MFISLAGRQGIILDVVYCVVKSRACVLRFGKDFILLVMELQWLMKI